MIDDFENRYKRLLNEANKGPVTVLPSPDSLEMNTYYQKGFVDLGNMPSDQIHISDYSLVEKDDVIENIVSQIRRIQEDLGVYDNEDIGVVIKNKDDAKFVDSLEDTLICYVEKEGKKILIPCLKDALGNDYCIPFNELQQRINAVKVTATYLCDEGTQYINSEYGPDYSREPQYDTITIHPDIDLIEMFEKLQDQFLRTDWSKIEESKEEEREM